MFKFKFKFKLKQGLKAPTPAIAGMPSVRRSNREGSVNVSTQEPRVETLIINRPGVHLLQPTPRKNDKKNIPLRICQKKIDCKKKGSTRDFQSGYPRSY